MDTRRGFFGKLFGGLVAAKLAPVPMRGGEFIQGMKLEDVPLSGLEYVTPELLQWREYGVPMTLPPGHYTQAQMDYELLRAAGVSPKKLRKAFKGKL